MAITTHGDLYDWNIKKSIERHVRDSGIIDTYPFVFDDNQFDPSNLDRWAEIEWVYFGPTIFSKNTFHVRCYSRPTDDRFMRKMEEMIGTVRNLFEIENTAAVTFYDYMNDPDGNTTIDDDTGTPFQIAIRFVDRGVLIDGQELGESAAIRGVHLIPLSFDAHVARIHAQW